MRTQPPVHSPLPMGAVLASLRAREGAERSLATALAQEYGAERVLLTGSGTQALQLAIAAALRAVKGSTVALPAYCCYDVATAAVGAGARITCYDLDPASLAPDQGSLREAFRLGAAVAVIAPLYGMPVPWAELESLAREHAALLIEDAAQGHGASWSGRPLGSHGALSVLSFGRGKGWTAGGGGALLGRGEGASLVPAALPPSTGTGTSRFARTLAQSLLARPGVYAIPRAIPWLGLGLTRYREPEPPVALSRAAASLALATRAAAAAEAGVRRERAEHMIAGLPAHLGRIIPDPNGIAGYLRLPVLAPTGTAPTLVRKLARLGVAPAYPTPLPELEAIPAGLLSGAQQCPGASHLVQRLVTLPTHSLVAADEADSVLERLAALARP